MWTVIYSKVVNWIPLKKINFYVNKTINKNELFFYIICDTRTSKLVATH